MFRSFVVLVATLASLISVAASAQDAILGQKYGDGVHAYFAGDYTKAHEQLTSAVNAGSKDPRVFYFRGLTCLRLGRRAEAEQDFGKGAGLESKDPNKFYNVAKALERVQGAPRVELEKFRVEARMAALEYAERFRKARYEAIRREESRVLRQMPPAPPEPLIPPPAAPKTDEIVKPAVADPFGAAEETPAPKAEPAGKKDAKPAAKKSPEKPAAEQKPAAEEPPTEKPEADPFA